MLISLRAGAGSSVVSKAVDYRLTDTLGLQWSQYVPALAWFLLILLAVVGLVVLRRWVLLRPGSRATPSQLRKRGSWITGLGFVVGMSVTGGYPFLSREPKPPQAVEDLGVLIVFLALCVGGLTHSRAVYVQRELDEKLTAEDFPSSHYEQVRQAGVHTPTSDVGVAHTDLGNHLKREHGITDFSSSSTGKLIEWHHSLHDDAPPAVPPAPPPPQFVAATPPAPPSQVLVRRSKRRIPEPVLVGIAIAAIIVLAVVIVRMTGEAGPSGETSQGVSIPAPPDECETIIQKHLEPDASAFPFPPLSLDEKKTLSRAARNWLVISSTVMGCVKEHPGLKDGDLALVSMAVQLDTAASAGFLGMPSLKASAQAAMLFVVATYPDGCFTDIAQEYVDTRRISIDALNAALAKIDARECSP